VATHYSAGVRRPASHSAQRHSTPHFDRRRVPTPPSKSGNNNSLTEGRKEVICTTTRTLQGVTFPAYPFLRKTAGALGEKTQNLNTGAQGIKTLIQNNSSCINLNAE
jgi:hypothetical protein